MDLKFPNIILFDWDNTLVDSWGKLHKSINHVFAHFHKPLWSLREAKVKMHRSRKDYFPEIFGSEWELASEIFYEKYISLCKKEPMKEIENSEDLLKQLKLLNVDVGVVSNKHGDILRSEVKKINWEHYFDTIIGSKDASKDKPHAEPVKLALSKFSTVENPHVWFVGDTIIDIECAVASECHPVFYGEDSDFLKDKGYIFSHVKSHKGLMSLINSLK